MGRMKANNATAARPETNCLDAAALLVRHRISTLPFVDASSRLVGLDLIGDGDTQTMGLAEILGRSAPVVSAVRIEAGSW